MEGEKWTVMIAGHSEMRQGSQGKQPGTCCCPCAFDGTSVASTLKYRQLPNIRTQSGSLSTDLSTNINVSILD
jgi:hypothetical protein